MKQLLGAALSYGTCSLKNHCEVLVGSGWVSAKLPLGSNAPVATDDHDETGDVILLEAKT